MIYMLKTSSLFLFSRLLLVFNKLIWITIWTRRNTILSFVYWGFFIRIALNWILINLFLILLSISRLLPSLLLLLSFISLFSLLIIHYSFICPIKCFLLLWTFFNVIDWLNRFCSSCFLFLYDFFKLWFSNFPLLLISFFLIFSWSYTRTLFWLRFRI